MSKRNTYTDEFKTMIAELVLKENKKPQEDILKIYNESNKVYGAPKIREKLKEKGYKQISLKRVQRHMKKSGIRSKTLLCRKQMD
jgi:putative transposase